MSSKIHRGWSKVVKQDGLEMKSSKNRKLPLYLLSLKRRLNLTLNIINEIHKKELLRWKIMITTKDDERRQKENLLPNRKPLDIITFLTTGKEIEFHVFLFAWETSLCSMMVNFRCTHIIKIQFTSHPSNNVKSKPLYSKTGRNWTDVYWTYNFSSDNEA